MLKLAWSTYLGQTEVKAKKQQNELTLPSEITHSGQLELEVVCFVGGVGEKKICTRI